MELFDEQVDYYEILGIERDATIKEIKNAFKKKSKIYHPDRSRNKTPQERLELSEEFTLITKAYNVLSDESLRRQYDKSKTSTFYELRGNFEQTRDSLQVDVPEILEGLDPQSNPDGFRETFNKEFEKRRAPDPNDEGAGEYGKDLAPRRQAKDGMKYTPDDVEAPDKIFDDPKEFDPEKFHKIFEQLHGGRAWGGTSIVHIENEEPEAINGDLIEGTDIGTKVSSFGGLMIVGEERGTFDSVSSSDYRGAFGMSNPTFSRVQEIDLDSIERKKDKKLTAEETKRLMDARLSERDVKIIPGKNNQPEDMKEFMKKKEEQIIKDTEKNRDFVRKYSSQFNPMLAEQAFNSEDGIQDEFTR